MKMFSHMKTKPLLEIPTINELKLEVAGSRTEMYLNLPSIQM